jgi:hypothetical protein
VVLRSPAESHCESNAKSHDRADDSLSVRRALGWFSPSFARGHLQVLVLLWRFFPLPLAFDSSLERHPGPAVIPSGTTIRWFNQIVPPGHSAEIWLQGVICCQTLHIGRASAVSRIQGRDHPMDLEELFYCCERSPPRRPRLRAMKSRHGSHRRVQ